MRLGSTGVWRRHFEDADAVAGLGEAGFSAVWLGASPSVAQARPFLERCHDLVVATGILNVWKHDPAAAAAERAEVVREFGDRFLLGIGIGHPEATSDYTRPLATMTAFFDGLDAADPPVPREQRIAAALGPKMLDLAAERTLGAFSYFVPPEHTSFARDRIGPDAVLAVELAVVLEPDDDTARRHARAYAKTYLALGNYTRNLKRFGFTDRDIAGGGSDRLIDAVITHGPPEAIADAVRAHRDAGADHVCLQPLGDGPARAGDYRALADAVL